VILFLSFFSLGMPSFLISVKISAGCWWLKPVILATQEADLRRITVQGQPGQVVFETLSPK
jgi:hypothetical protein